MLNMCIAPVTARFIHISSVCRIALLFRGALNVRAKFCTAYLDHMALPENCTEGAANPTNTRNETNGESPFRKKKATIICDMPQPQKMSIDWCCCSLLCSIILASSLASPPPRMAHGGVHCKSEARYFAGARKWHFALSEGSNTGGTSLNIRLITEWCRMIGTCHDLIMRYLALAACRRSHRKWKPKQDTTACKKPSPLLMQMFSGSPSLLQPSLAKRFSPLPLRVRYWCTVQACTCTVRSSMWVSMRILGTDLIDLRRCSTTTVLLAWSVTYSTSTSWYNIWILYQY